MTEKKKVLMKHRFKENPWILTTIILGVLALVLIFGSVFGSATNVGNSFVKFVNDQGGAQIEYVDSQNFGSGLYEVTVLANGNEVPVYVTRDGKYWVQIYAPLFDEEVVDEPTTPVTTDIPKSDKPKVELFIWSYCPYGVTAQGPLAEVASLLEDYADFVPVLYYAGHGEYELQQNKIQACIRDNYPDKYWAYAAKFVDEIYPVCSASRDVVCDKDESTKVMKSLGIDSNAVFSCVDSQGEELYAADSARAQSLGVTGSPTLVVNGVKADVARTAEAFKTTVCGAFTDAPESCGEALSSAGTTAAGNC